MQARMVKKLFTFVLMPMGSILRTMTCGIQCHDYNMQTCDRESCASGVSPVLVHECGRSFEAVTPAGDMHVWAFSEFLQIPDHFASAVIHSMNLCAHVHTHTHTHTHIHTHTHTHTHTLQGTIVPACGSPDFGWTQYSSLRGSSSPMLRWRKRSKTPSPIATRPCVP